MPKTKRDLLKRQVAHAWLDLDKAGGHLAQVIAAFIDVHPELAAPLVAVEEGILIQQDVLKAFVKEAWGMENPDWLAWQNEPERRTVSHGKGRPMDE